MLSVCETNDFLGSTLAVRKGDLKGFGLMLHAFSIASWLSSRYQKTVFRFWSMVIIAPWINFLGLERDL